MTKIPNIGDDVGGAVLKKQGKVVLNKIEF